MPAIDMTVFQNDSQSGYENLSSALKRLEGQARESLQDSLKPQTAALVRKLENGVALLPDERSLLELLIVGDASDAVRSADAFNRRKAELQGLIEEINRLVDSSRSEDLLRQQTLCRQARRGFTDILAYLQDRERVERFQASMRAGLDRAAGKVLAEVIQGMMDSSEY